MSSANRVAEKGESAAAETRSKIARVALVGKAMLYGIFALLAVNVVTNSGSTSTSGAIEELARGSWGQALLIALTIGLVTLVAWRGLQAIVGDPVEGSDATDRAKYGATGLSYAGVAAIAIGVLMANWGQSTSSGGGGGDTKQKATSTVLGWPGGQWLVIIGGLAILAFGLYEFYRNAVEGAFTDRLDTGDLDPSAERAVEIAGRAGYAAQATITAIAGAFLVAAGVQHDPDETKGISGVLKEMADTAWGGVLLWAAAAGLIAFALFTLAEARLRRTR
jgi:hypothetical protein